jgi:hypothetical protein
MEDAKYCTVKQICDDPNFCFTQPMLRYYLLIRHKNGLDRAVRKVGKSC